MIESKVTPKQERSSELNFKRIHEAEQSTGIRPYGPGKFSTILDQYVYSVSLDGGADEEESFEDGGGWYGLMRNGRTIFQDHDPLLETLNQDEQEQLTSAAGVILYEDSQGFVYVDYYDTDADINVAWAKVQEQFVQEESNDEL